MEYSNDYQFSNPYIQPGEYVTWKGRPEKGNYLTPQAIVMIPFSLIWCGFAIFWEYNAIQSGVPAMMLFGLPFVAIGLYLVFGRFLHSAYLRGKTFYVITNKKLIIKKGNQITVYSPKDLPPMTLHMHRNGNGTITYQQSVYTRKGHRISTICALENIQNPVAAQSALSAMED